MHLQNFKLLRRRLIYKKIQGQGHTKHRPVHHVIYASTNFEVDRSNSLGGDELARKYSIGLYIYIYSYEVFLSTHLHHVTYACAKFEVATSNSLGGDAFTRKYIMDL